MALLASGWLPGHHPTAVWRLQTHLTPEAETVGKIDPLRSLIKNRGGSARKPTVSSTRFVHNPMLDAGGDIGVDPNGFKNTGPPQILHRWTSSKLENWRVPWVCLVPVSAVPTHKVACAPMAAAGRNAETFFVACWALHRVSSLSKPSVHTLWPAVAAPTNAHCARAPHRLGPVCGPAHG